MRSDTRVIHPGGTIGVLGSGQLGRMLAIAARRMGYRIHVLSPDSDTPAGQVADLEIVAPYTDLDAVGRLARAVDVVTFEFENIPPQAAAAAAQHAPLRPGQHVLKMTQNRLREKAMLNAAGFETTRYAAVRAPDDIRAAVDNVGLPAVLKTADFGYDGKGQVKVASPEEVAHAWSRIGGDEAILERHVEYQLELSVVAARGLSGRVVDYGAIENHHALHVLDYSIVPARIPQAVAGQARRIARSVLEHLQVVGVMTVEFFLTHDHRLLINELAPRPHNSGHLTIDTCVTDQFEQQVRAVCGLPLGATRRHGAAAMVNLLGDCWKQGVPDWPAALSDPDLKLHLYGKSDPRSGRKMGHLTALARSAQDAVSKALAARDAIKTAKKR